MGRLPIGSSLRSIGTCMAAAAVVVALGATEAAEPSPAEPAAASTSEPFEAVPLPYLFEGRLVGTRILGRDPKDPRKGSALALQFLQLEDFTALVRLPGPGLHTVLVDGPVDPDTITPEAYAALLRERLPAGVGLGDPCLVHATGQTLVALERSTPENRDAFFRARLPLIVETARSRLAKYDRARFEADAASARQRAAELRRQADTVRVDQGRWMHHRHAQEALWGSATMLDAYAGLARTARGNLDRVRPLAADETLAEIDRLIAQASAAIDAAKELSDGLRAEAAAEPEANPP